MAKEKVNKILGLLKTIPAGIYLLKVNNRNTRQGVKYV